MLTPADIDNIEFSTTRLKEGYDQGEVDAFLDRVRVSYDRALKDAERLKQENQSLRRQAEAAASADTIVLRNTPSVEKVLALAQRTADQLHDEANAEAGQIRAAAKADADGIRAVARNEASTIAADAEQQRQKILNQLEDRKSVLDGEISQLLARRLTIKGILESTLAKIQEGDVFDE